MPSINYELPEGVDAAGFLAMLKRPKSNFFPVPDISGEYVLNADIALNQFAALIEKEQPNKKCIGFESINENGQYKYRPVLIDKS